MWSTSNVFGSSTTVRGSKLGLVHARRCALNETATITELVIVEAVRACDSGGQAMWEPSDDMSGGEIIQKYRTIRKTQNKPQQRQVEPTPVL